MTTPFPLPRSGVITADRLAAAIDAAGITGPVLVIADNRSITNRGPAWAGLLAPRGIVHRVRLWEGPADSGAPEPLVAEALRFGATAIIAAGVETTCTAAEAVARAVGIPCMIDPPPSA